MSGGQITMAIVQKWRIVELVHRKRPVGMILISLLICFFIVCFFIVNFSVLPLLSEEGWPRAQEEDPTQAQIST